MKKFILALSILCLVLIVPLANADVTLATWGVNWNGIVQAGNNGDGTKPVPPAGWAMDDTAFDGNTGLGTIIFKLTDMPGPYFFVSFLDHDIGPFPFDSNTGFSFGTPGSGQTWQLGPPGYPGDGGDTFYMFAANTLKNLNEIEPGEYGDISAAFAWNFMLPQDYYAVITLRVADTAPGSPFYLSEFDASTGEIIYLSQDIEFKPIPEPGTLALLGAGLAGAAAWAQRKLSL
jgi:PEP-CTERM motif